MASTNKLVSIEWLRGIASLGVCQMHIFCAFDFFSKNDYFFQNYIFPISITGRAGVAVFFIISGFIIPFSMYTNGYTIKKMGGFLARRLTRLEPPYLVSILLVICISILIATLKKVPIQFDYQAILLHFGYLNVFFGKPWLSGVYWTLAIEFQFYILIAFIYPLLSHQNSITRLITFSFLIVISIFAKKYISDAFIFPHLSLFLMGFACFLWKTNIISNKLLFVKLVILLIITFFNHNKANTFFSLITLIIIYTNFNVKLNPFYFLGRISYSLYLYHSIIGLELLRYSFYTFINTNNEIYKITFCLASIGICIYFAYIMYNIIEKPSLRWTKKIKY